MWPMEVKMDEWFDGCMSSDLGGLGGFSMVLNTLPCELECESMTNRDFWNGGREPGHVPLVSTLVGAH